MKKSTKKLLGLGTSLLIGSAGVIAGIGVLKLDKSESTINEDNASRSILSGNFRLNDHDAFTIGNTSNSLNIKALTPNVTKPVPNGYVTVNESNQLICIDKNDPNKILWYDDFLVNDEILAIEYTPNADGLVVLHLRNIGNKKFQVWVSEYKNISSSMNGNKKPKLAVTMVCPYDDMPSIGKGSWGLSPIYKMDTNNVHNGRVVSYLIYPKVHDKPQGKPSIGSTFYRYDVRGTGNIQPKVYPINVDYAVTDYRIIMGMGSWLMNNTVHVVMLTLINEATFAKPQVEYLVQQNNKYVTKGIQSLNDIESDLFASFNSWNEVAESNISGAAFNYNRETFDMKVTFALNVFKKRGISSFHYKTRLFTTSVSCNNQLIKSLSTTNLWEQTLGGYFDNSVIAAKGISSSTTSAPLILEGYDSTIKDASKGYEGRFTAVISDATSWDNKNLTLNQNLNDPNWRIYMQMDGSQVLNESNSRYYGNFNTTTSLGNGLGIYQGAFGIPVLEYHDTNNDPNTIFNLNVMFMKNGSNNGIIINQKDRGPSASSAASYGYQTQSTAPSTPITGFGNINITVDQVNKGYLDRFLEIGKTVPVWHQSRFMQKLGMKNVRDDAKFLVKPDTIRHSDTEGTVSFDLYSTIVYTQNGKLNYETVTNMEAGNWNPGHKIGTFTITGFKPTRFTTIDNFKIDSSLQTPPSSSIFAPYLVPSEIVARPYNKEIQTYFKNLLWQSICSGQGFTNLRQKPTYNANTWAADFNDFFISFDIDGNSGGRFSNRDGSVTLNVQVSTRWAIPPINNGSSSVSFNSWVISGLRKFGATEFVDNSESTSFNNPNWNDKNIPYVDGLNNTQTEITWPSYVDPTVKRITVNDIKEFLFTSYIKPAYTAATKENQYDTSTQWVKNVAYKANYGNQSLGNFTRLTKDNIIITNYEYFPAIGKMKLKIRLNVWNMNDAYLHWDKNVEVDGQLGGEYVTIQAPFGTWWIGGFRKDNVTTSINNKVTWELSGINNIPAGEVANQQHLATISEAIVTQGVNKGYLKFPYWVNINSFQNNYSNLIGCELVEVVDAAQGIAKVKITFKTNYWAGKSDGKVLEEPNHSEQITIKGFKLAKPIKIDSSKFFELSTPLLTSSLFLNPTQSSNTEFANWLNSAENAILEYIVRQDQTANQSNANTIENWRQRIKFQYLINNNETPFESTNIIDAINQELTKQNGKLGFMYSDNHANGIKLWVKIKDLQPDSPYTLEDISTNTEKGSGLKGLLDTQKVILQLDMNAWIQNLATNRGTLAQGVNEQASTIQSIKPPVLSGSDYGSSMEFSEIEKLLKEIGYKFEFSWKDSTGLTQTSNTLPTNFSYNSTNPIINVTISYADEQVVPKIYIFNDHSHSIFSATTQLSLAVKKTLKIDYSYFKSMYQYLNIGELNKNITIDSLGAGDLSTINAIKTSWTAFENQYWELNNPGADRNEYEKQLEIVYSVNGSNEYFNLDSMWTKINEGWAEAVSDITKIGRLRFYSPTFANGTKIQVKVRFKNTANQDEYAIDYVGGEPEAIVNHKLSTTFDMNKYATFWSTTKSKATEGSTFDHLKGFTPATFGNVTFDQFETATKQNLGLLIQYSNDSKTNWVDLRESITSVDQFDPAVYMRFSSKTDDYDTWGNNFEIKNFSTGVTDTINNLWSSGVKLPLNLPKYLQVEQTWIDEFIAANPLSGNTKYLNINEAPENELINKILEANPPLPGTTQKPSVWLEYRLGNTGEWHKRLDFINTLKSSTQDATTNLIQIRVSVDPIDVNNPVYAVKEATYDLNPENIGANAAIKIYVNESYENQAKLVSVYGTNDNFQYRYGELPVSETGEWTGAKGLTIQWTTDTSAIYGDLPNDSKWQSTQINSIDPIVRYLAIRIIAKDGYVYGASYTDSNNNPNPMANIHIVNVNDIGSKIDVDINNLKQQLNLSGYVHALNVENLTASEQTILNAIPGGENLGIRYQVILANGTKLNNDWTTDANGLKTLLANYSVNYNDASQGLIKFKVGATTLPCASIKATFVSTNNQFIPIDKNGADLNQGTEVNTDQIKTKVDLSSWYAVLKTKPTSFEPGSTSANIQGITPPGIEGTFGSGFLVGMNYVDIVKLLESIGLQAEFKAPGSTTQNNWVPLTDIHNLNNANELYIRFKVIDEFANSVEVWGDSTGAQDNANPVEVKLIINLPITLVVLPDELKKLQFIGHTAGLTNFDELKQVEKTIIDKIILDSQTNDPATNEKIKTAKLGIQYLLVGKPGKPTWMTLDAVYAELGASTENFSSNEVKAKVVILENPPIDEYKTPQFQLSSDQEVIIQPEQFTDEAKFKVYIHRTNPTDPVWIQENKYLEGSETQYTIKGLDAWQRDIEALKGLELEFNSVSNNGEPADNGWSTQYNAHPINKDKDYWVRFKVKPGFIFEDALNNNGSQYSRPIKLDASRIKITISLQSAWLEQLVLTGNTKALNIDETAVIALVNGQLPAGVQQDLIKIQYTVDGQEWLTKTDFINKLNTLDGGISETKWIILREDIKARFIIDSGINNQFNPPYGLSIDGSIVENDSQSPIVQLIDDAKSLNSGVKGYINTNKFTPFVAANFFVTGTNTKAILRTQEVSRFNAMLDGYKSAHIFDILYTSEQNIFDINNKVWNSDGRGIVEELALNGNFANKYIAINLKASSDKYDVYRDNRLQTDGYIISSPDIKVSLSIEIVNPLIGKQVAITYVDDNKQAIFYQNQGSFLFKVNVDGGGQLGFEEFINQLPTGNNTEAGQYTPEMKNALELAYYVSNRPLTPEEYNEVIKPKNIQAPLSSTDASKKYGVWKSVPALNNTTNLNLAVNDYIIVALRVKPEFLSLPSKDGSGFVLKDNNHTPTKQSRAHGYKIRTSDIEVNWDSIEVKNVGAPVNTDKGLDGFAVLNKLSLVEDAGKNYQGVSLKLNYFNKFYRNAQNQVLVSNAGDRLVKRDTTGPGIQKGDKPYYGSDGKPIRDNQGQEVFPYYDSMGRPSNPVKGLTSTRSLNLSEKENNVFSFYNENGEIQGVSDVTEYSLFANQYIEVEFMNKKGLSTEAEVYDYYVDQPNVTRQYTLPTSLIKFLVSNVNNIRYEFNSTEFKQIIANPNPENVFVNTKDSTQLPKNGESRIKDDIMYKVTKTETGQSAVELSTLDQIRQQITSDFNGQIKLQTSIRRKSSNWEAPIEYGRIQGYDNLQNGDFIKVEIVPTNDEFVYAQQPEPLTFQISTLTIEDASTDLFKWLRVEQVGEWNGEGSFRIYVDDPNNPNDDNLTIDDLSNGKYYFEAQVWGVDPLTNASFIKHKWTRDIDTINDLKNGDKVAWQLRSPEGTVSSAYFNTVADITNHNVSENKYSFVQINKRGLINVTPPVPQPEGGPIGPKPADEDAYPETSGFEIDNLRIRNQDQEFTSISYDTFANLMTEMDFSYQGVDGNGNMISSKDPRNVYVDIEKPSKSRAKRATTTFTLQYLIDQGYLSFAYNTTGLSSFNRFSWSQVKDPSGNYLVAPGLLSNGDKVKAIYKDETMSTAYEIQLSDVSGLSKKADSMSMFVWVGIGIASVATLGIFPLIYFFARNRKLKV